MMAGNLKYDPLTPFVFSTSPAGLYARQRWLGGDARLAIDMKARVAALKKGQRQDGSWGGSPLESLRRLFGLHLTQREPDPAVERALDWLLPRVLAPEQCGPAPSARQLAGLPFAPSRADALWPPAGLFLAAIFGRGERPEVVRGLQHINKRLWGEPGLGWGAAGNLLRALAVHLRFQRGRGARAFLARLAGADPWPRSLPFHQTVNALAHLPGRQAVALLRPCWPRLTGAQAADGWWGRTDREFKSFLVVHALKNAGWRFPVSLP
ncbi:MAG: hypothetical protein KQH53_02430 [Desulfarculaceae bacterium]|nr:hypothetical protein [Desulfarculaceae bacterium]